MDYFMNVTQNHLYPEYSRCQLFVAQSEFNVPEFLCHYGHKGVQLDQNHPESVPFSSLSTVLIVMAEAQSRNRKQD